MPFDPANASSEELRTRVDQLESLLQRHDRFLGELAHELGNVMFPLQLVQQILERPDADAETIGRVVPILAGQLGQAKSLVENLRGVSRLSRGYTLERTTVDLRDVVRHALSQVEELARSREVTFERRLPEEAIPVLADAERLQTALVQLFDNAMRYSPDGRPVDVTLTVDGGFAVLVIHDRGPGIPADQLPHVFEAFIRGDEKIDWERGHLGVGLTIARQLVQLHEGEVALKSSEGSGTEVTVRLPCAA